MMVALALSAGFAALLWTSIDSARVATLIARATLAPIGLALLVYALDFFLRALRFWLLLDPRRDSGRPLAPTVAPFVASFGVSDILPFRLGDVFRLCWFCNRLGWPAGLVIGAMLVERLLDLLAILVIAAAAVWAVQASVPAALARNLVILLAAGGLAILVVLLAPRANCQVCARLERSIAPAWVRRLCAVARSVAQGLRMLGGVGHLSVMLLLSIALWLLESLVMLGAWVSLGGHASDWLKPLVAFAFSTLGTLFPALPGHFGTYDAAGALSFYAIGVPVEQAAATILLAHLLLWLPTVLFAIGWFLLARHTSAEPEPHPEQGLVSGASAPA